MTLKYALAKYEDFFPVFDNPPPVYTEYGYDENGNPYFYLKIVFTEKTRRVIEVKEKEKKEKDNKPQVLTTYD